MNSTGWDQGVSTIVAALIAAGVVVAGFFVQKGLARSAERGALYADAVRAVHDYVEAPYLILRHDGSDRVRWDLVRHVSEIQSRLTYFQTALDQLAPTAVADSYRRLVQAARREAGAQMTVAWRTRPVRHDRDVPLGTSLPHPETVRLMEELTVAMSPRVAVFHTGLVALVIGSVLLPVGVKLVSGWLAFGFATPIAIAVQLATAAIILGLVLRYRRVHGARVIAAIYFVIALALAIVGAMVLPII